MLNKKISKRKKKMLAIAGAGMSLSMVGAEEITPAMAYYDEEINTSGSSVSDSENTSILAGEDQTVNGATDSAIVGGNSNTLESVKASVILGGGNNTIKGTIVYGDASSTDSVSTMIVLGSAIVGGDSNLIKGDNSAIVGSTNSTVLGDTSGVFAAENGTIKANAKNSAIMGGKGNTIDPKSTNGVIVGGQDNLVKGHDNGFIGGGYHNTTKAENAAILGGNDNLASEKSAVVIGGQKNTAEGVSSIVIGGDDNLSTGNSSVNIGGNGNYTDAYDSIIIGGEKQENYGEHSAIVGGSKGEVKGQSSNSAIVGGLENSMDSVNAAAILGGNGNIIESFDNEVYVDEGDGYGHYEKKQVHSDYSAIIGGHDNKVSQAANAAVVAGHGNTASGESAVVVGGSGNEASGHHSVAIGGINTKATNENAVAMNGGKATGKNTLAIGSAAEASNENSIALHGKALGKNTVAIGADSVASKENAVALGDAAQATSKSAVAIGALSVADEENTVSVGSDENNRRITHVREGVKDSDAVNVSQLKEAMANAGTNTEVTTSDGNIKLVETKKDEKTTSYDIALSRNLDADSYSVGGKTYVSADGINANDQKIKNVADGEVVENSTDAVNGGQLYQVKKAVDNIDWTLINTEGSSVEDKAAHSTVVGGSDNTIKDAEASGVFGGKNNTIEKSKDVVAKSISGAVVLGGSNNTVDNNNSAVISGHDNTTHSKNSVIIGGSGSQTVSDGSVVVGGENNKTAGKSWGLDVVIGGSSNTTGDLDAVVVGGRRNSALGQHSAIIGGTNNKIIGDDTASHHVGTNSAIVGGSLNTTEGENAVIIGGTNSKAIGDNTVAIGGGRATARNAIAIGFGSQAQAKSSVAIGDGAVANEENTVSVGSLGHEHRITNVSEGTKDTDAVNVKQLKKGLSEVENNVTTNITNNFDKKLENKADIDLKNINEEGKKVIKELADSVDDTAEVTTKDKNLKVSSSKNGSVTTYDVAMARDIDVNSVSVNGTTYISSNGLNANNQRIQNVEAGIKDTDAVNVSQLKDGLADVTNEFNTKLEGKVDIDLKNVTEEGKKVVTDLAESVEKTSTFKAGDKNVVVSSDEEGNNTEFTVKLADDIEAKTFGVNGKTYISEMGLNANGQKVVNVADGEVAENSKDAINGGQLHAVKTDIESNIKNVTNNFDAKLENKANIDLDNITSKGEQVIKDLANSVDDTVEVTNTDGNLKVSSTKNGNVTSYDVNLAKDIKADSYSVGDKTYISNIGINANGNKIINVANGEVSENSTDAVNGSQLYKVQQSIANKVDVDMTAKADVDLKNINEDGKTVVKELAESVEKTTTVKAGDDNVKVSAEADGNNTEYTVKLGDNIEAKTFGVNGKTYISETGLNANGNKVVNVANGEVAEGSTDAVNGGQLHKVKTDIEGSITNVTNNFDKKLENKADIDLKNINEDGKKVITDLAESVEKTSEVTNTDGNLMVTAKQDGNNTVYDVNLAKDIKADSFSVGDKTYITNIGINANSQKITNVAGGDVAEGSTDAVNGNQLYNVQKNITNKIDVDMSKKADIDLTNITDAGKEVIKELADSVDDTAEVTTKDKNIKVTSEKNGNVTSYDIAMARDLDVDSLSAGGKTYITNVGINANSQKIINVASGEIAEGSTDAVNGGQLHEVQKNITNNVDVKLDSKANVNLDNITNEGQTVIENIAKSVDTNSEVTTKDKNLKVTSEQKGNTTVYDVAMARDLDVDSLSVGGKTYLTNVGINANSQKITNVANGEVSKDSHDAVNGSQLFDVQQNIANNVDNKLEGKANINLDNINEEGEQVIKNLAKSVDTTAVVRADDTNIVVSPETDGNVTIYKVKLADTIRANSFGVGDKVYINENGFNANNQRIVNVAAGVNDTDAVNVGQLKQAINDNKNPLVVEYDSEKKDTVTLKGENGTTIDNVKDGKVSKDSKEAINGSQLYDTNQKVEKNAEDIKNIKNNVTNNTNNINQNTEDIKNLKEADKLNVKYTDESQTKIVLGGEGGTTIKNVKAATEDDEAVNYKQLNDAIAEVQTKNNDKNAVHYTDDSHEKAVLDGEGGTSLTGVSNGEVSKDSQDAVNGSQLYDEQEARKKADKDLDNRIGTLNGDTYNVIKAGDNVSQNLVNLDKAIAANTNNGLVKDNGKEITIAGNSETKVINVAGKGGETRVITGVQTNPADGASAANVDYVNSQTKKSQEYANGIGAQAAAMSSLHPLDWDKKDKVSVAASVGAYKSEVAGAVGAFYRPDRKTMVSFQGAFGHNDNMFGVGVSKKFGNQETEEIDNDQLQEKLEELTNENKALQEQNSGFAKQLAKISDAYNALLEKVNKLLPSDEK